MRELLFVACLLGVPAICHADDPDFTREVKPILTKYCAGCHNDDDAEGKLSLESFSSLQVGGESGPALMSGNSASSRLIRVMTGQAEPSMPPEDEPRPTNDEIELLIRWIDAGAKGPQGATINSRALITPKLTPSHTSKPITAVAFSPDGETLAVARFKSVELRSPNGEGVISQFGEHPGKVNSIAFSKDGSKLVSASGVAGLFGEVRIWDVKSGELLTTITGHRDAIYTAKLSPRGKQLATGSYDKRIILWDVDSKQPIHTIEGHNGAIYDIAFSPDGGVIASASADTTVKIWSAKTGKRLDTRSEPLKEQYSVDISPDGKFVVAAGEDNRIRMWRPLSVDQPEINPLIHARYAHEGTIESLRFTPDGKNIVSVAADQTLKVWDAEDLQPQHVYESQPDNTQALAVSITGSIAVGRMDGSLSLYPLETSVDSPLDATSVAQIAKQQTAVDTNVKAVTETEPNNSTADAMAIQLPAQVSGMIDSDASSKDVSSTIVPDVDYFRFTAMAGQEWIVEVKASRDGSSLDSHIEVLTSEGRAIPRVLLQAVRDSYFTFRGKDSRQTGDFRLHNWEEMKLNQFLFSGGEVVKLYHYPRGPDSGFNVYPNTGNRHAYFDTSSVTHALHEPCYVVRPYSPGAALPPNGLPTFTVYYENDDESTQSSGSDSKLTFIAPDDGEYVVRVRDVRGFSGDDFNYKLVVRQPSPDFTATVNQDHTVGKGTGKKLSFKVSRVDGFDGEVRFDIEGLPDGFHTISPVTVEAGQLRAWGIVWTDQDAPTPTEEAVKRLKVTATAMINGKQVVKEIGSLGELKLSDEVKLTVDLQADHSPRYGTSDIPVIELQAGSTTTATIRIDRRNFEGRVGFGSEEGAVNAPHGVFVDNIGLNGLLIVEGATERQFFLRAEPWVKPVERVIFVEADAAHRPTSHPVLLRILPNPSGLQASR